MTSRELTIEPIGYVRTAIKFKDEAPRQPRASGGASGRIELLSGRNYEHALLDIEGWDHIWVLFWFHLNAGWRPKVLPPRSTSGRKGVFATRSPHRPNPIGLSAVRLERIEGLTLHVHDIDMLDGTPVLDHQALRRLHRRDRRRAQRLARRPYGRCGRPDRRVRRAMGRAGGGAGGVGRGAHEPRSARARDVDARARPGAAALPTHPARR